MSSDAKMWLEDLAADAEAHGRIKHPHPWQNYLDMLRDSEGNILSATACSFTIPVADGEYDVEFPGGLTGEHWDYFSPHLDAWGKTLLAKGILRHLLQPKNHLEWCEALEPLRVQHGHNEEQWLPQLVQKVGFDNIAQNMKQAVITFRAATSSPSSIVNRDSTGLLHSDDYRVCKDKAGNVYNLTKVVAKLIEVLNLALQQGLPELNGGTLLREALKQSVSDPSLANVFQHITTNMSRLDHYFRDCGVWKSLVFSGTKKGCYRLVP